MKLPRGLSGSQLIAVLKRLGYKQTRQTGSHARMTISLPRQAHLTVPLLRPIPPGTLDRDSKPEADEAATKQSESILLDDHRKDLWRAGTEGHLEADFGTTLTD